MAELSIALPDGTLVSVPSEVLNPPKAAPELPGPARAGIRGIVRGLFTPADMVTAGGNLFLGDRPKTMMDIPSMGAEAVTKWMGLTPSTLGPKEAPFGPLPSEKVESMLPRRGTGAERYLEEGVAGGTGAMMFPGAIIPKVLSGVAGGTGGEFLHSMIKEPWARVAGALAGGVSAYPALQVSRMGIAALGGPSSQTPKLVSEAARGTTPQDWEQAGRTVEAGRAAGVPVTPVQALPPGPLHGLQEKALAASPEAISEIAKQTPAARLAATKFLGTLAPEAEPSAVATRAQGAAEGAIEKARKFATTGTAPYYEITRPTVADREMLMPAIKAQLNAAQSPAAREFLESQVFSKLSGDKVQSVEELKNVINEAKTALKAPNIGDKGIDRYVAGKISTSLDELEKVVSSASANRPLGHKVYKDIYDRIVNPMRQSLTGKIAGVKGVVDEAVPPTTRILGELNAPTVRAESIRKLAADMTRAGDAQAFPALVRGTWEQNLEKAFGGAAGQASPDAPARFAATLRGTAEQTAKRENFRATIAEVARANGLPQKAIDEAVVGAERFMSVMEAAGRAKGGMTTAPSAVGAPAEALLVRGGPGVQPYAQVRWWSGISDMLNRRAYGEIAQALTSPQGIDQLRKWASFDLGKYRLSGLVSGPTAAAAVESRGD